jgi:hemerythrin-like domain-containing protein
MAKATDKLLTDHRLIRKVLEGFLLENPRFPEVLKTLHRAAVGHAWFEDEIFLPALVREPFLAKSFTQEITQEHIDINNLLKLIKRTPANELRALELLTLQLRTILDTHFKKEEDALFPAAEKILDSEGLNRLGDEMERRKTEIRDIVQEL